MPPFQFRIESALRRTRTLSHSPGIPLSLPGVEFAGELPPSDAAVWRLLFLALDQDEVRGYWGGDECCEGCVSNSQSPIRSIESLIRLTRSSLGRDASRVSLVLLSALSDGIREFRDYVRSFTPDDIRGTPWGDGSRTDFLNAMHVLRTHLRNVLRQVAHLLNDSVTLGGVSLSDEEWSPDAYVAVGTHGAP